MYSINILHNFETAHRLCDPRSPQKCQSIHGHSWWIRVTVEGPALDDQGMLVEFGLFKKKWRAFVDDHVDHHLLLHQDDHIVPILREAMPNGRLLALPFHPTTECLVRWLAEKAQDVLDEITDENSPALRVSKAHLQETKVNGAEWVVPAP